MKFAKNQSESLLVPCLGKLVATTAILLPMILPIALPSGVLAQKKKMAKHHVTTPTTPQKVKASYYDDSFQGKKTASGEKFHQGKKTAASKTLPLGSTVQVKNVETGKQTTVVVNDRGPYVKSRAIDLSKSAAKDIGIDKKEGVGNVEISVIATPAADK